MVHPDAHTVTGTTPEGTTVTVQADETGHGRVIITSPTGAEVMVGTTFTHDGVPHFWPGPTGGLALSPTTLRLMADLIDQAHQEQD